jgi:hypothetical protein
MDRGITKPGLAAAALLIFLSGSADALANPTGRGWGLCGAQTARLERARRIPDHLLMAISLVESGRHDGGSGRTLAWPWTVTAEGRGRFLDTKSAAILEVQRLRARGIDNIDVGCMQVNLYWHGDAFSSLAEAFDPARNVTYAADLLVGLRKAEGSWDQAMARYHSRTPRFHIPYAKKVRAAWRMARAAAQSTDRRPGIAVGAAKKPGRTVQEARRERAGIAGATKPGLAPPLVSRRTRVERNAPRHIAWRQARSGGFRSVQIILRKNRRHIVLKPGRTLVGRATPVTRDPASTAAR